MLQHAILLASCVLLSMAAAASAKSSPNECLAKSLEQATFTGALSQAMDDYRQRLGCDITVDWAALREIGVTESTTVSVQLSNVTAEQALNVMLNAASPKGKPLGWYADSGGIHISTQARVLNRRSGILPVPAVSSRPATTQPAGVDVNFDATPLSDAIDFFRQASGVNFHVNWNSLQAVGIDRGTSVTIRASGISIAKGLDLLVSDVSAGKSRLDSVYWIIDDEIVLIASGSALNTTLHTRLYDIADLLMIVPNFQAPRINVQPAGSGGRGGSGGSGSTLFGSNQGNSNAVQNAENPVQLRQQVRDELIAAIQNSIGPDMWQPIGKGSIRIMGGNLIISQTLLGFKLLEGASR